MGDYEAGTPVLVESTLEYHPRQAEGLTPFRESGRGTLSDGQFDWGGRLLKCNGGARKVRSDRLAIDRRVQEHKRA